MWQFQQTITGIDRSDTHQSGCCSTESRTRKGSTLLRDTKGPRIDNTEGTSNTQYPDYESQSSHVYA